MDDSTEQGGFGTGRLCLELARSREDLLLKGPCTFYETGGIYGILVGICSGFSVGFRWKRTDVRGGGPERGDFRVVLGAVDIGSTVALRVFSRSVVREGGP